MELLEEKQILNMKLHQAIYFDDYKVLKVHGGWIYTFYSKNIFYDPFQIEREIITSSSTFVPDTRIEAKTHITKKGLKSDFSV